MTSLKNLLKNLVKDESGQDLIEYALVAALVGLGAVASMKALSGTIGNAFNTVGNNLSGNV
jgi:pilus assembly protein Flp/PilA